jgi:hypothetical protein
MIRHITKDDILNCIFDIENIDDINTKAIAYKTFDDSLYYLGFYKLINERYFRILNEVLVNKRSFESIGNDLSLTRERVRQLGIKGCEKIVNNATARYIMLYGISNYNDIKVTLKLKEDINALKEEYNDLTKKYNELSVKYKSNFTEEQLLDYKLNHSVNYLDLSKRPLNCLRRNNINTIQQLVNMSESELFRLNQLGKKSFDEIILKLKNIGLTLRK